MLSFHNIRRVGVISDTHSLLRPAALRALEGSDLILHAGDVGAAEVLERLRAIAPVVAVRGNNDRGPWARDLQDQETVLVNDQRLCVLHDQFDFEGDAVEQGLAAVITGHTHRPLLQRSAGVLFLNPGSIGPRRFSLPISLALLDVSGAAFEVEFLELEHE